MLVVLLLVEVAALAAGGYQNLSSSSVGLDPAAIVVLVAAALLALWALFFIVTLPVRVACMRGASESTVMAVQLSIFVGIWFGSIGWWVAGGIAVLAPPGRFDWYASQTKPLLL